MKALEKGHRTMARKFRMALTLVVASIALIAHAQAAPPPVPGGGGATSTPTPFFMGSTHSYTYYDADWVIFGPGTLTISSAGLDPYNGAALIDVQLKQGAGRYFYGSGVSVSGKLYFTIG